MTEAALIKLCATPLWGRGHREVFYFSLRQCPGIYYECEIRDRLDRARWWAGGSMPEIARAKAAVGLIDAHEMQRASTKKEVE